MCNSNGTLSLRERDILRLVYRGQKSIRIGEELGIARGTVDVHIHNILHKLGVASRKQAAKIFAECPICQSTHDVGEAKHG